MRHKYLGMPELDQKISTQLENKQEQYLTFLTQWNQLFYLNLQVLREGPELLFHIQCLLV